MPSGRPSSGHSPSVDPSTTGRCGRHDGVVCPGQREQATGPGGDLQAPRRGAIGRDLVRDGDEVRYGAIKAGWGDLRRRGLERDLGRFVVVQPDDRLMVVCAELRAECERTGHGLGQKVHEADRWIAATALRLGIDLISDDAIFQDVDDLHVLSAGSTRTE